MQAYDPIHALRVVSDFAEKVNRGKVGSKDKVIDLMLRHEDEIKNDTHKNIYRAYIYVLSEYKEQYEPEVFHPVINYCLDGKHLVLLRKCHSSY